jgi:hypothetical protein
VVFLSISRQMAARYFMLGEGDFIPHSLQFIINLLPYPTLQSEMLTASSNKSQYANPQGCQPYRSAHSSQCVICTLYWIMAIIISIIYCASNWTCPLSKNTKSRRVGFSVLS